MTDAGGAPALSGVLNFRDLGGLPTTDGRCTRRGVVYRSDALEELTDEDVRLFHEDMNVTCVVDLRAHVETGGGRPRWASDASVDFVNLPMSDGWSDYGVLDDSGRHTLMARKYISYLDEAGANVAAALRRIARNGPEAATVVHCALGKDRTGVVVALLLSIVGVTTEAIVADYMQTAVNVDRLMERVAANDVYMERMRTNPAEVYRAEEHTIRLFLEAVEERFGGTVAWALDNGLEQDDLAGLRAVLVEGASTEQRSALNG